MVIKVRDKIRFQNNLVKMENNFIKIKDDGIKKIQKKYINLQVIIIKKNQCKKIPCSTEEIENLNKRQKIYIESIVNEFKYLTKEKKDKINNNTIKPIYIITNHSSLNDLGEDDEVDKYEFIEKVKNYNLKEINKETNNIRIFIVFIIIVFIILSLLTFLYIVSILIAFVYIAKKERLKIYLTGNYSKTNLILYSFLGPFYFLFSI